MSACHKIIITSLFLLVAGTLVLGYYFGAQFEDMTTLFEGFKELSDGGQEMTDEMVTQASDLGYDNYDKLTQQARQDIWKGKAIEATTAQWGILGAGCAAGLVGVINYNTTCEPVKSPAERCAYGWLGGVGAAIFVLILIGLLGGAIAGSNTSNKFVGNGHLFKWMSIISIGFLSLGGIGGAIHCAIDLVDTHRGHQSTESLVRKAERLEQKRKDLAAKVKDKLEKEERLKALEQKLSKPGETAQLGGGTASERRRLLTQHGDSTHSPDPDGHTVRRRKLLSSYVVTRACHKYTEDLEKRLLRQLRI